MYFSFLIGIKVVGLDLLVEVKGLKEKLGDNSTLDSPDT